jgi:uncharacterized protein
MLNENKDLRGAFFDTPDAGHYHTALMSTPPDRPLDALGLARGGAVIERSYPLAGFARLRDRLAEPTGSASVRAEFSEARGLPLAALRVDAEVVLSCQRCLGRLRRRLESESRLAFAPEETPDLPEDHEPVGGDPHRVDLAALVEDELLLSLPVIALHEPGETCAVPAGAADAAPANEMRRPFAGLKDLLKQR